MTARPELRVLTSVRGIAAWMVVLYHIRYAIAGLGPTALAVLGKGYLAVDFFFLLSGFVIWLTYGQRLREGGLAAVPDFLRRRLARIWPLHGVVLAGAVALILLLAATGRHDAAVFPFTELPLHVLLIQNWGFTDRLTWNDPAWSISCELAAYLCFPLVATAVDWRRLPTGLVVTAIAALFVLLDGVFAHAGAKTLGHDIPHFGLVRCLIEFVAGGAVCALWLRFAARPGGPAAVAAALVIGLATAWLRFGVAETLAVPAALAATLLALALTSGRRWNWLERAPLHYLGEISYATYLSHFMVFFVFKLAFVRDAGAVPPGLIALYLATVLVASVVLYHAVERPAQAWINRLRWPRRAPAAAPLPSGS